MDVKKQLSIVSLKGNKFILAHVFAGFRACSTGSFAAGLWQSRLPWQREYEIRAHFVKV